MQAIGFLMLVSFFSFLYFGTAQQWGYWVAAKMWISAFVATGFILAAMFLIKGGSL